MRSLALTPLLIAVSLVPFACATYEDASGKLGGPSMLDEGGSGGQAGSSAGGSETSGGTLPSSAGSSAQAGSSSNAGTFSSSGSGGSSNEGGGGAGGSSGGMGGTAAGMGGKAGAGGGGGGGGGGKAGAGGTTGSAGKGGNGGTGGGGAVLCSANALSARGTWVATASHTSLGNGMESDGLYNPTAHMLDGSLTERWSSGKQQSGDEWIQIDFGKVVTLSDITLQQGNDTGDFPTAYAVRVSNTSGDFNATVRATGAGVTGAEVVIMLAAPATGRYLTVRQTGVSAGSWWTIAEIQVTCSD